MTKDEISNSIAYCGLLCFLCRPADACSCRSKNNCGKRLSPEGCFQYSCCTDKGLNGCWECPNAPCGKDMLAEDQIKIRAFVTCIKEDGLERFLEYIVRNTSKGIVYHREGIRGDYDLESEAEVLKLLRTGSL
jgi:hypothetical protein